MTSDIDLFIRPTGFTRMCEGIRESLYYTLNMSDTSLVNIGCGTGDYICEFSPQVGQVIGVESNPDMIQQAKEKTSSLQNVKLIQGDPLNVPLTDGCCDIAFCTLSLIIHDPQMNTNESSKLKQFIQEVARITNDKGLFVVYSTETQEVAKAFVTGSDENGEGTGRRLTDYDFMIKCSEKGLHQTRFMVNNYDYEFWFGKETTTTTDSPRDTSGGEPHRTERMKKINEMQKKIENDKFSSARDVSSSSPARPFTMVYIFSKIP